MKKITERQEIAKALNFGKYPVLCLDLAKDKIEGCEGCYEGQRTKTEWYYKGQKYYHNGTLAYWKDNNKLEIMSETICLKESFGYSDIEEMVLNANATQVEPEQEVIVVIINSERRVASYPYLTKTGKYNNNCITAMTIEGDFKEIIEALK